MPDAENPGAEDALRHEQLVAERVPPLYRNRQVRHPVHEVEVLVDDDGRVAVHAEVAERNTAQPVGLKRDAVELSAIPQRGFVRRRPAKVVKPELR